MLLRRTYPSFLTDWRVQLLLGRHESHQIPRRHRLVRPRTVRKPRLACRIPRVSHRRRISRTQRWKPASRRRGLIGRSAILEGEGYRLVSARVVPRVQVGEEGVAVDAADAEVEDRPVVVEWAELILAGQ